MSIKESITDFIGAAANEKPVAAYNAFSAAVEDKVQGLLDQRQDEIRASLFATEETLDESAVLKKTGERIGEYLASFVKDHPKNKLSRILRTRFPSVKRGVAAGRAFYLDSAAKDAQAILNAMSDMPQRELFGDDVDVEEFERIKRELAIYTKAAKKYEKMSEETELNEDPEELEEEFGTMVMAVVAGNFLYELIGVLLVVLFAGAGLGVLKLKDMWDTYKELRADKQVAKELENFAKNSKVIKKVMSSRNALDDLHKNKKLNLKGLRGNARKEKEQEITAQMDTLLKELKKYQAELKQEIEDADLSVRTLAILKRKGLV